MAIEREGISIPDPITPELQPGDEVVVRDADWIERVWREFSGTGVVLGMKKYAGQSLTIKECYTSAGVRYKGEHIARYTNYHVEHNNAFEIDPGGWYWNELLFEPAASFAPESDKMVSALYDDGDLPEFDPLEVLTEMAEKATKETGGLYAVRRSKVAFTARRNGVLKAGAPRRNRTKRSNEENRRHRGYNRRHK